MPMTRHTVRLPAGRSGAPDDDDPRADPAEIDALTDGEAVARAENLGEVYGTGDAQVVAIDAPTSGRVVIDGVELRGLKDKALTLLRRDRLGFVFQAYNLVSTLTPARTSPCPSTSRAPSWISRGSTPWWTPSGSRTA